MEKVIIDLDLGAGFEVIWQQHHRGRDLAELIDLEKHKKAVRSLVWVRVEREQPRAP